jgi:phosphoribosyl 1,2-cyclic phosphodiesterase
MRMIIRFWGARGSIPVSGRDYLKYGGDTTCLEIRTRNDEIIVVDAGSGIRRLGNRLIAEKRNNFALLFTHAHWDHLMGFPFFKPIYVAGTSIAVHGCPFVQISIKHMIANIMLPPYFPVNFADLKADINYHEFCDTMFTVHGVQVTPISLSHPNQGVGYKFSDNGKNLIFLTDNELGHRHPGGLAYEDYVAFSYQAEVLIHDAEYLEEDYKITKAWGHSVYKHALQLAIDARVKRFGLFHHNQERSDAAVDEIVADCRRIVKEQKASLECFAVRQDMEISI